MDFKQFGWLNSTYALADGDITKKTKVRGVPLVEYLEFDSYKRWINYDKYLNQKEQERKRR